MREVMYLMLAAAEKMPWRRFSAMPTDEKSLDQMRQVLTLYFLSQMVNHCGYLKGIQGLVSRLERQTSMASGGIQRS